MQILPQTLVTAHLQMKEPTVILESFAEELLYKGSYLQ